MHPSQPVVQEVEQPRERLLLRGPHVLSDVELLTVLIGHGRAGEPARALASRIFDHYQNSWFEVGRLSPRRLMDFQGVGEAKALRICAALEIARRRQNAPPVKRVQVRSSRDAFEACRHQMEDLLVEQLRVLLLDRGNRITRQEVLTSGGQSGTVADPKLVFQAALEHRAASIILVHNHPSGNIRPSEADRTVTDRIAASGLMLDLPLMDHLIVGHGHYYSFADEGQL